MANETLEQQTKDSDMIFTQITSCNFNNIQEANMAIVMLYVPDMSISRAGISHAIGRLNKHFSNQAYQPSR